MFSLFKPRPVLRPVSVPAPVDLKLKHALLGQCDDLIDDRKRLIDEQLAIEQQINEHNSAISALTAALSSFEAEDHMTAALRGIDWSPLNTVDPADISEYNDGATETEVKSDGV